MPQYRPSWKATIRLSLVTVPVQGVTASKPEGGEIHFNQLHETCHNRIRYKKVCPVHGEVTNDEIVSGYEYAKDQYAIVDPEEIKKLRPRDKQISIATFVAPKAIDPIYFADSVYYLLPDGDAAAKSYAVLHQSMVDQDQWGVGEAILSGREQLVALRPLDRLLVLQTLTYAQKMRSVAEFVGEVPSAKVSAAELKLAKTLLAASTSKKFELAQFEDDYHEKLQELIDTKIAGKEVAKAPIEDEPPVINLMDALKASVQRAGRGEKTAKGEKKQRQATARPAARRVARGKRRVS
jgi:DNA end-binding protein Ku